MSPTSTSLVVIKISTEPSVTVSRVSEHLSANLEGTMVDFNESNISRLTDMGRVKKIYKMDDKMSGKEGRKKHSSQIKEAPSTEQQMDDRKEIEMIVLGQMALRGLT